MPSANVVPNQTALHGAAEHGFDKIIEFLAAHGADLNAKDASGRTALEVARGAGGARGGAEAFPKTVALLESLMGLKPAVRRCRQRSSGELGRIKGTLTEFCRIRSTSL
jgi:hypothetical protein